jgi:hypothetical protein
VWQINSAVARHNNSWLGAKARHIIKMEQPIARPLGDHVAVVAARNGDLLSMAGSMASPAGAAGAGARAGAGEARRRSAYSPYLDRIALSANLADTSGEFWRRLLIQPVVLPDMAHTGIRTMFDNPEEGDLLGPDGRTTRRLKALIRTRVVDEQREAEEALSPKSGQSPSKKSPKMSGRAQDGLLSLDASLQEAEREGEAAFKRGSPAKLRKPQASLRPASTGRASPSPKNNGDSLDLLTMIEPAALARSAKPHEGDLKGASGNKSDTKPKKHKKKSKAKRAAALKIPGQRQQRKEPFSYSASRLFELILERTYGK